MHRIYFDYAASTPVDPEVVRAMQPYFSEKFGNPGSLHSFGQEAIAAVDGAREAVAKAIGAGFRDIIFTASATEANNLALRGAFARAKEKHEGAPRVIVSAIEHESVLETVRDLERVGAEVVYLRVNREGVVDLDALAAHLERRTALVSVMYANNELGTVEPIREIAALIRESKNSSHAFFHTDAAQAFQFLACDVGDLGVDAMTLSGHKFYGPKGAGVLYLRDGGRLPSLFAGGGQEFGMRSGTENVPSIVGMRKAVEFAAAARAKETARLSLLRERLRAGVRRAFPPAEVNGSPDAAKMLPNIVNMYFPGRSAEELLTKFDLAGLAASSGSACRSRAIESSHVIRALGFDEVRAKSSIRFSLGRPTTEDDVEDALRIIARAVS